MNKSEAWPEDAGMLTRDNLEIQVELCSGDTDYRAREDAGQMILNHDFAVRQRCEAAEKERDDLAKGLNLQNFVGVRVAHTVSRREAELREVFTWLLGEGDSFPERPASKYNNLYWWRTDLRKRLAALSSHPARAEGGRG